MEQVILEVMKDSGRRADYRVFNNLVIRIGRGYGNDLILTDPYVSESHCVIRSQESGFILEDLSTLNGTYLQRSSSVINSQKSKDIKSGFFKILRRNRKAEEGKERVTSRTTLYSGDQIFIGQTRLRFFIPSHQVEAARPIVKPSAFFEEINTAWRAFWLVVAAILFSTVLEHQESFKNLSLTKFVSVGIGLLFVLLVWAGIWSFIGWLIKKRDFFNAHLSWVTLFFLVTSLCYPISEHLGYAMSNQSVEILFGACIFWVSITTLIAGHLIIATYIPRFYQILWASLISLAIIVFGLVNYYAGQAEFKSQPDLYATLIPPYGKLGPSQSIEQFLNNSTQIYTIKVHGR